MNSILNTYLKWCEGNSSKTQNSYTSGTSAVWSSVRKTVKILLTNRHFLFFGKWVVLQVEIVSSLTYAIIHRGFFFLFSITLVKFSQYIDIFIKNQPGGKVFSDYNDYTICIFSSAKLLTIHLKPRIYFNIYGLTIMYRYCLKVLCAEPF